MTKLLLGVAAINKAIASIHTRGKKLDKDIQLAALSVINHVEEHRDVTVVNTLIAAMPKGSRVNALREFIMQFGKVAYNEETKDFSFNRDAETDLEGAASIMWTEFKPEAPFVPLDLMGSLTRLLKKADKEAEEQGTKFDTNAMNTLRTLVEAGTPELEPNH